MEETETSTERTAPAAPTRTRRSPARRKPAARKSPPRRKKAPVRSRSSGANRTFASLVTEMGAKAAAARGAARRAWKGVGETSRKTIARLTKEWQGLDAKRRAQFVAAILAALAAAASTPIVRGRLKK